MEKKLLGCVIIAIGAIIGCIGIIEEIGVLFGDITFARFLFGFGVFTGVMVLWLANVLACVVLRNKIK